MKKSLPWLFFMVIVVVSSCNTSNTSSEQLIETPKSDGEIKDELYQEVIEVHDIAMLKLQTIMTLKSAAIKEADSLRDLGDEVQADRIEELEKSELSLEEANKSMMMWMRAFRSPADSVSHEKAMEYLRSEYDKIAKVDSLMDQVVENAKAL